MTTINLKDFYYWYLVDELVEVPDEVAEELMAGKRAEAAHAERTDLSLPLPHRAFSREELTRQQILEYLTDHVSAAPRTLAQGLGLSLREVQGALAQLTRQNLVVPQGQRYQLRA